MQSQGSMPAELSAKLPPLDLAQKGVPTMDELRRLGIGYKRLQYLLDNWEKETTVCIRGCKGKYESCGCVRDPIVVQGYMGYKSTTDPLFKADVIIRRAEPIVADADFERCAIASLSLHSTCPSGWLRSQLLHAAAPRPGTRCSPTSGPRRPTWAT